MIKKVTVARKSLILLTLGFAVSAAWAAPPTKSPTPPVPTARVLDLKAPDIHQVMSDEQIAATLPNPEAIEVIEPETVAVRGDTPAPYVPGGFAALYWAGLHPFDSWRILAPVQ